LVGVCYAKAGAETASYQSMPTMADLFMLMHEKGASDIHITAGAPPMLRIDGALAPTPFPSLSPADSQALAYSLLSDAQRQRFEATNELDIAIGVKGVGRLRLNVFRQRGAVGVAIRSVPDKIRSFEELGLPAVTYDLMKLKKGLILVTGPTGSGKSTTLASMIDFLNVNHASHIMTVEDPIEFVHGHKKGIVNQREIGSDTESFGDALKYVLRQDPNVILIGEMRDLETISAALTVAETGHLVFATLHTSDAAQSINRMIDVFPPHQQDQIRTQLSFTLQAILCQQLLPRAKGGGRVMALELLVMTSAARNQVRERKIEQMMMTIQTGAKFGMQTMNQALSNLYTEGEITYQDALAHSLDVEDLKKVLMHRSPTHGEVHI